MVTFNNADEFMSTMSEAGGTAFRFTDIDGIGPSTRDKITSIPGVDAPRDVADYTADDLAEEAGISKSRAQKAIRGGGGNPSYDETRSSGSVSAGNLVNQMEDSRQQSTTIVQERKSLFEQLVETGEEIPDRRERRRNPDANPFSDRDPDEIRQVGQTADIFSDATADPVDPTAEKADLGFDEDDREKASQVRIAAIEALEEKEGLEYDEATSEVRGSPSNPPAFDPVQSALPTTGSQMRTFGDFRVESEEYEEAQEEYQQQSPEARQVDSRRRAPITTNEDRYAQNPGKLDFPGVDTPSSDPNALPKDYKRGGDFETTEVDEETEVATGREPEWQRDIGGESVTSFDIAEEVPEGQVPGVAPGDFEMGAGESMVSMNVGGPTFNRKEERVVETDRLDQEQAPPEEALQRQSQDDSTLFQFPEWTLSRGQTYLNEKVYGEEREDLRPLREKVRRTNPGQPVQMDKGEYNTFQRIVREGAEEEIERADEMEANIFGDTDKQAEIAEEAIQGIINNPPR